MPFLAGMLTGILIASMYATNLYEELWQEFSLTYVDMQPVSSEPGEQATTDAPISPQTEIQPTVKNQDQITVQIREEESAPAVAPQSEEFQLAWIPFRSETSASGFANKLSQQLGIRFQVIKRGPGQYEVGFRYASGQQRDEVLEFVESLTGYRAPHNS
ncbi:MAG: hypothetical protein HOC70_03205 [Gammaproteobacteria bacterium]|jgi:hypothetical protein|nr:hypothetical protein [Gammaproteobacteria bacterium]MBT4492224.1 hypothetical protein [Gammaproteobacteria bacterium]MBT7371838.1 hypothetical protein [Gammaproteobacteria bacterium]